jgi:transcriptional regulator with XRE-family HTH domain
MKTDHPLKAFREEHKPPLTQEELAIRLGVTRTTVARWETGTRRLGEVMLPKVSKKTGIPVRTLRPDLAVLMGEAAE